jgi:catechol 2,3-dioxygenase-like lactoylglutathione lyase family enzyme
VNIWYRVSDLDAARGFYTRELGFRELYLDEQDRWARLERDGIEIALAEGEMEGEEAIATVDVPDVKAEAERLRAAGIQIGVVVEIPGTIRLLDVFDPDGNRLQLSQDL